MFLSEQLTKRVYIDLSSVVLTFIDNGKLADQIARVVAIVAKIVVTIMLHNTYQGSFFIFQLKH